MTFILFIGCAKKDLHEMQPLPACNELKKKFLGCVMTREIVKKNNKKHTTAYLRDSSLLDDIQFNPFDHAIQMEKKRKE